MPETNVYPKWPLNDPNSSFPVFPIPFQARTPLDLRLWDDENGHLTDLIFRNNGLVLRMFFREICRKFHGIFPGNMGLSQHFKQSNRKKNNNSCGFHSTILDDVWKLRKRHGNLSMASPLVSSTHHFPGPGPYIRPLKWQFFGVPRFQTWYPHVTCRYGITTTRPYKERPGIRCNGWTKTLFTLLRVIPTLTHSDIYV